MVSARFKTFQLDFVSIILRGKNTLVGHSTRIKVSFKFASHLLFMKLKLKYFAEDLI